MFYEILMFISFSSKLFKYISIAVSLFLGSKVDFGLNLFHSNSFSSFGNILAYAYSSILSFALLIWLLVGTNFNLLDNNEIFAFVSFHLDKFTTFLLTKLSMIRSFKINTSLSSSFEWLSEWLQPIKLCLSKTSSSVMSYAIFSSELLSTKESSIHVII